MENRLQQLEQSMAFIQSQQLSLCNFVEAGLAHITKQLDTILRNNKVNAEVIEHLKQVVQKDFVTLYKLEGKANNLDHSINKLYKIMKFMTCFMDEKSETIDNLKQSFEDLQLCLKPAVKIMSPLILPAAYAFDSPTPRNLTDSPSFLDLMCHEKDVGATPELFPQF
jgi:hypothetical protein